MCGPGSIIYSQSSGLGFLQLLMFSQNGLRLLTRDLLDIFHIPGPLLVIWEIWKERCRQRFEADYMIRESQKHNIVNKVIF